MYWKSVIIVFAFAANAFARSVVAQEVDDSFLPQPVGETDFEALQQHSPFTRSLNLSESLILTGVARIEEEEVATLMNKETNETFVVSSSLNSQGWKMVELKSDGDLEKVAAKVSLNGGEVVTVRYGESQLNPSEARPGGGGSGGSGGEGERRPGEGSGRGPPPEMRAKLEKLSEEQRGKLYRQMLELRAKKPDISREERLKLFSEMADKLTSKRR